MANGAELATLLKQRRDAAQSTADLRGPAIPSRDEALQAIEIGDELNVPPQSVVGQPVYQNVVQERRDREILQGSPRLNEWMRDGMNAAVARDDAANLSALEKGGNAFYRGALNVNAGVRQFLSQHNMQLRDFAGMSAAEIRSIILPKDRFLRLQSQGVAGQIHAQRLSEMATIMEIHVKDMTPEDFDRLAEEHLEAAGEIRQEAAGLQGFEASDRMRELLQPVREREGMTDQLMGALQVFAENPGDALTFFGETLLESAAPMVAGAATTALTRNPGAGIAIMGAGSGTAEYAGMVDEFLMEQGVDIKTEEGRARLLSSPELMSEANAKGLAKGLVVAMLDVVSGGIAGQQLANSPAGDVIIQSFVQAALGGSGEALGTMAAGEEVNAVDVLMEAMVEMVTAVPEGGLVAGRWLVNDAKRAAKAGRTQEGLENIDRLVAASETSAIAPELFADAVDAIGLNDGSMILNAEAVQTYFQEMDLNPVDFGFDPLVLEEQAASGGDVTMTLGTYATAVSGTEHATFFQERATLSDGEMSAADAAEFQSRLNDDINAVVSEIQQVSQQTEQQRVETQTIQDQIEAQLVEAGQISSAARNMAQMTAAFYSTMSSFMNMTPLEMLDQFQLRIEGPMTPQTDDGDPVSFFQEEIEVSKGQHVKTVNNTELTYTIMGDGDIAEISKVFTSEENRREGSARNAMVSLLNAFDNSGMTAFLTPDPIGKGASKKNLTEFYKSLGFVPNKGSNKDFRSQSSMIRFPQKTDQNILYQMDWSQADQAARDAVADGTIARRDLEQFSFAIRETNGDVQAALDLMKEWDAEHAARRAEIPRRERPTTPTRSVPRREPLELHDTLPEDAVSFEAAWGALDTQDYRTEIRPNEELVEAYVNLDAVSNARLAGGVTGYDWSELERGGFIPPVTVRRNRNGTVGIIDGNHRIHFARENGHTHIPAYVFVERGTADQYRPDQDQTLFQSVDPTDSEAFRQWAGEDAVMISPDEVNDFDFRGPGPFVMRVFHGTTHEFTEFDASIKETKEGHFGAVNYFSTSEADADSNYGGVGPDLTNRLENLQERLFDEIERIWAELDTTDPEDAFGDLLIELNANYEFDTGAVDDMFIDNDPDEGVDATLLASHISRTMLDGGDQRLLEVYVRTEKPFVVGGDQSPFIEFRDMEDLERRAIERVADDEGVDVSEIEADRDEFEDQITDARWEIESEEPSALYEAIETVAMHYDLDSQALFGAVVDLDMEGADHSTLESVMRNANDFQYAEDPEDGSLIASHVIAEVIRELGFDSIVLKNANEQFPGMDIEPGTAHVQVFDQFNTNIKSVENQGTFDRSDPDIFRQGERGSITFRNGRARGQETVIRLTEAANLSTYLHESGHLFLQMFSELASDPNAPTEMIEMLGTIHDFVEHQGGDYSTRSQEKWARAFETYLMEGKAPSTALRDAFRRFKHWLLNIYQHLTGVGVQLTPEIRDVMDRMLATQSEIDIARSDMAMSPLFTDAAPVGMSDAEFRPYDRLAKRTAQEAEERLLKTTMEKIRRERKRQFKNDRAAMREAIEEDVNNRPVYRLIEALTNRRWIGSQEQIEDFRLNRQQLVDRFGPEIIAEIGKSNIGGRFAIYSDDGADLGFVAEMFGFETIEAMVDAVRHAGKRKDRIEQETDREMFEIFGDPLNDGSIKDEALRIIHSENQAKVTATEARVLAKRAGRNPSNIRTSIFRQRARDMIARMRIVDAAKPNRFLTIERQAARNAQREFAKVVAGRGDVMSAIDSARRFKEQQLLHHYLYLEARALEREVDRGRERMRRYSKDTIRKKLEGGYIEQIDALLEQFEFRRMSQKAVNQRASLAEWHDQMIAAGREGEVNIDPRLLSDARRTHYSRLSVEELRGLFDTIANIDHMGRYRQKLTDAKRKRDFKASAERIVERLEQTQGKDKARQKPSKLQRFTSAIYTPDTMLSLLDQEEFGPLYDELKRGIDEGAAVEQQMSVELAEKFHALFDDRYSKTELRRMQTERVIEGGNGHAWSKMQILSLALNMGNADNRQRVFDQTVDEEVRLTEDQAHALLSTLDNTDWQFVQGMWDLIESYWPQLAAAEQRRTGTQPKKVDAAEYITPTGITLRGGYFPIKYDNSLPGSRATDTESEMDKRQNAMFGSRAQVNNRMAKERQKTGGGRPIQYDMSVPFVHLRDTVRLIALGEAIDNTGRLLNYQPVIDAFKRAGRNTEYQTLKLWLGDVASGPIANHDLPNSFARSLKSNFTLMALGFNVKTMVLQLTGFGQSAAVIGKRNMVRGIADYMRRPHEWLELVTTNSVFMQERRTTFQKDVNDFMTDVQINTPIQNRTQRAKEWMAKAAFAPITWLQFYAVDMPTWIGAYHQAIRDGHDQAEAIHRADRMVERSQGGHLISDRAGIERGTLSQSTVQSDWWKLTTTLGGYMLRKMNRGVIEVGRGSRAIRDAETTPQAIGEAFNMATNLMLLYMLEAALITLANAWMAEDPDDEDVANFFLWELSMAVVGGVPLVRDIMSPLAGFSGGGIYGSATEMPARVVTQITQGEADTAAIKAVLSAIGLTTGFPSVAVGRVLDYGMDDAGEVTPAEALFGRNSLDD